MAEGVELANHWTHSAPCSPSRATMMTGRYLPGHEVYDNTVFPWHHSLDPAIPTVGSQLGGDRLPIVATSASGTSPVAPRRRWTSTATPTGTATTSTSWGGRAPGCTSTR